MNILVIEDEIRAARRLEQLVSRIITKVGVNPVFYDVIDSVQSAVPFLQASPPLDLVFMDIHLADGLCFEIVENVSIHAPVVFTTAFDEYAIRAFQLHSIDYLLKPIDEALLERAIDKFFSMKSLFQLSTPLSHGAVSGSQMPFSTLNSSTITALLQSVSRSHQTYKSRFLVNTAQGMVSIPCEEIAYFYSEHKISWLTTLDAKKYAVDYTLEQLSSMLQPESFFRINRQCIVHLQAVVRVSAGFNGKLKVILQPNAPEEMIVGREKAGAFKDWLDS